MEPAPAPLQSDNNSDGEETNSANLPSPEANQPPEVPPASSSSSSSSEEEEEEEPARKKRRRSSKVTVDPRVDALFDQVSALTNFIMQQQQYTPAPNMSTSISQETVQQPIATDFLTNPSTLTPQLLELGTCKTDFNDKKYIKPADTKRLKLLCDLQHFNSPTWQHIRYSKALHEMVAQPGFCNLKVNEELCCLNKGKDFLAPTELVIAALTNALLYQRELLQSGLQGIIDWAHKDSAELNPNNLFAKISETFGQSSSSYKLSEQALQIVCGKRAECVEIRRQKLIAEIPDKNIQTALLNIPPSEEFLFEKNKLSSLIHSLGGPHFWLSQPQNYKKDRSNLKRKSSEPIPSTSRFNSTQPQQKQFTQQDNYKKQTPKQNYKNKNNTSKQTSFRNKKK